MRIIGCLFDRRHIGGPLNWRAFAHLPQRVVLERSRIFLIQRVFLLMRRRLEGGGRVKMRLRLRRARRRPLRVERFRRCECVFSAHLKYRNVIDCLFEMSLGEIGAVQELMRLAVTGQQHLDALVGYYRGEIDRFNEERAEWAVQYQQLKASASNKYSLEQELDRSRHRINQLQASLNTTKAALNANRQQYFQMLEDSQGVKERLEDNRKRYRDLVAACKPITVAKHKQEKKVNNAGSRNNSRVSASGADGRESAVREGGEAELELINLGKEHDQRRTILQQKIDRLKEELEEILSEHSSRGRSCAREYGEALEGLGEAERKVMELSREYFKLRMNSYEEQRRLQEENEILRLKAVGEAKRLQNLRESHSQELKTVEEEVKQRNKLFRNKYDEQLRNKEEHLAMLKQQNEKINHIYLLKLKKLQAELQDVTDRQKAIDDKTNTEVRSLKAQIKILKARQQNEGLTEMRAELARDDEEEEESSGTLSMSELENLNRQVTALQKRI